MEHRLPAGYAEFSLFSTQRGQQAPMALTPVVS
jgi:hypothetical protein